MTLEQFIIRILEKDVMDILFILLCVIMVILMAVVVYMIITAARERKDGPEYHVYYTYEAAKVAAEEDQIATQQELLRLTRILGRKKICRHYDLTYTRKMGTGIIRFCLPEEKNKDTSESDISIGSYLKEEGGI